MRKKKTTEEFVKRAREIHGNIYDYSKTKYNKSNEKVCIICPTHGEFWQEANSHLRGVGCPKCRSEKISNILKMSPYEFIYKARTIHGDKYDYSKVKYVNNRTKVCIICPEHGEFWQTPNSHLSGKGCKKCRDTYKLSTDDFINKARKIHGNKYDYSMVEYKNNKTKVCIICPEHGEFWQIPNDHLNGHGCSKCSGTKKMTTEEFIESAMKIHGSKYDYSKVEYKGNKEKVCVVCPKHGEFWISPNSHLSQKQGCKKCKKSKMEMVVSSVLSHNNIDYIYQYSNKDCGWLGKQSIDFFIPNYNVAIECQGEQHYKSVKMWGGEKGLEERKKLDEIKRRKCEMNNIRVIYVGEDYYADKYNIMSLKKFSDNVTNILENNFS